MDTHLQQQISKLTRVIVANSLKNSLDEFQTREQLCKGIEPFVLQCERAYGNSKLIELIIQYLAYTHAFPRTEASVFTYLAMLEVMIDIALPIAVPEEENMEIYKYLLSGIEKANLIRLKNNIDEP